MRVFDGKRSGFEEGGEQPDPDVAQVRAATDYYDEHPELMETLRTQKEAQRQSIGHPANATHYLSRITHEIRRVDAAAEHCSFQTLNDEASVMYACVSIAEGSASSDSCSSSRASPKRAFSSKSITRPGYSSWSSSICSRN